MIFIEKPGRGIRKRLFPAQAYLVAAIMPFRNKMRNSGRKNILIPAGTGLGKTTFGNTVLHGITVMEPQGRQIITPRHGGTKFQREE